MATIATSVSAFDFYWNRLSLEHRNYYANNNLSNLTSVRDLAICEPTCAAVTDYIDTLTYIIDTITPFYTGVITTT